MSPPRLNAVPVTPDDDAAAAGTGKRFARPRERDGWLGVEIRHLLALQAVARTRSFRQAAEELGYVQSAISQQIAFLERRLGARLLERSRGQRPVRLTPAGSLVAAQVEEIVALLRAAQADMEAVAGGRAGMLRVGVLDHLAVRLMPAVLRRFTRRWPQSEIFVIDSGSDATLLHKVGVGELDAAFAHMPLSGAGFEWEELTTEHYVLVVPAESSLAAAGSIECLEGVARIELIQHRGCRHAARAEGEIRARGVQPVIVREAHSAAAVQALVGAGVGSALLPRMAADRADPATTIIEIGNLVAPRTLVLARSARRPPGACLDGFVSVVREVLNAQAPA